MREVTEEYMRMSLLAVSSLEKTCYYVMHNIPDYKTRYQDIDLEVFLIECAAFRQELKRIESGPVLGSPRETFWRERYREAEMPSRYRPLGVSPDDAVLMDHNFYNENKATTINTGSLNHHQNASQSVETPENARQDVEDAHDAAPFKVDQNEIWNDYLADKAKREREMRSYQVLSHPDHSAIKPYHNFVTRLLTWLDRRA